MLYCIALLHCIVFIVFAFIFVFIYLYLHLYLYCIVLYCIVLYSTVRLGQYVRFIPDDLFFQHLAKCNDIFCTQVDNLMTCRFKVFV